jgi:hypothetical protein
MNGFRVSGERRAVNAAGARKTSQRRSIAGRPHLRVVLNQRRLGYKKTGADGGGWGAAAEAHPLVANQATSWLISRYEHH